MTPLENRTESFVVRIWVERREIADALPVWRGLIEHVGTGKRQYFLDLDSVVLFMVDYMDAWGVKPKSWVLLREKLRKLIPYNLLRRSRSIV